MYGLGGAERDDHAADCVRHLSEAPHVVVCMALVVHLAAVLWRA